MLLHYVTPRQKQYLREWASRTSRSFVLMFPHLDEPMDSIVAAAYQLCRVADNIEDGLARGPRQRETFAAFRRLLAEPARAREVLASWSTLAWIGLTPDEAALMSLEHQAPLWEFYGDLPAAARTIIHHWVDEMARGMLQAVTAGPPHTVIRGDVRVLATAADVDLYCHIVAGTAGRMLTDLAGAHHTFTAEVQAALVDLAGGCGRALQKTNILKDFAEDLARGVCYLPDAWLVEADLRPLSLSGAPRAWRRRVILDVLADLEGFLRYIAAVPRRAVGFRLGMLICVVPAYATLRVMAEQNEHMFTPRHTFKISRAVFEGGVADARRMVDDEAAIVEYGARAAREIDALLAGGTR